jgi:hypothetical protein
MAFKFSKGVLHGMAHSGHNTSTPAWQAIKVGFATGGLAPLGPLVKPFITSCFWFKRFSLIDGTEAVSYFVL